MTDEELGHWIRQWPRLQANRVLSLTCYVDVPDFVPVWEATLFRLDCANAPEHDADVTFQGELDDVLEDMAEVCADWE